MSPKNLKPSTLHPQTLNLKVPREGTDHRLINDSQGVERRPPLGSKLPNPNWWVVLEIKVRVG